MKKTASFEEALKRLEEITAELEGGEISLEDSLRLFEEAAVLSAQCSSKLNQAEQKIVQISARMESAQTENSNEN